MNKLSNIFFISAILIAVLYHFFDSNSIAFNSETVIEPYRNYDYQLDLSEAERIWVNDYLKEEKIGGDTFEKLYNPQIIKSHNGRLFIGDYGDMVIKIFDENEKYLGSIGDGLGQGPSEFSQFTDFYIEDDIIYVIDVRTFMVKQFSLDGTYLDRSFSVESFHPSRIAGLNGHLVILGMGGEFLFHSYNKENGTHLNSFGVFIEDQVRNQLSVQGHTLSFDGTSEMIFVPRYASFVFFLNEDSSFERIYRTHDGLDFTSSRERTIAERRTIGVPDRDLSVDNISLDSNYLYLLYRNRDAKNFVDVYDLSEDKYLHSFMLPFNSIRIEVTNDTIYLVEPEEGLLKKFKMNKNSDRL